MEKFKGKSKQLCYREISYMGLYTYNFIHTIYILFHFLFACVNQKVAKKIISLRVVKQLNMKLNYSQDEGFMEYLLNSSKPLQTFLIFGNCLGILIVSSWSSLVSFTLLTYLVLYHYLFIFKKNVYKAGQ